MSAPSQAFGGTGGTSDRAGRLKQQQRQQQRQQMLPREQQPKWLEKQKIQTMRAALAVVVVTATGMILATISMSALLQLEHPNLQRRQFGARRPMLLVR